MSEKESTLSDNDVRRFLKKNLALLTRNEFPLMIAETADYVVLFENPSEE